MVKDSQIDVEPKHLTLVKKILKRHITYKTVWAYGSRVNWTADQYSDLDLVVFDANTVKLGELKEDFAECDLPFSVDIVLWEKIPENFKNKILEKYVALQKKPELEGWKECRLGDVASKIGSGATPRGGSNVYKDFGVSLIRSQNVLDFEFSRSGLVFIDDSQANELKNVEIQENDVLLNITGDSVARCCIVPNNILPARVNQHVSIIRLNPESADYKFVFYSVLYLKDELLMQAEIGATRKALTKGMVENLEIFIPPLPEQKTIASVLSSLDDKIDLLHRQNKTLEAMAETLFRQWLVEEAKGDWEEDELGQVVETTSGGTPSRKKMEYYENGFYPWVKSKELTGSFITTTEESITEEALMNSSAKLLPENSILIAMYGATVGEYAIIAKEMTCNQAICALKPNDQYPYTFLFMLVKYMKQEIINMAVGSAQQNISQLLIKKIPVLKPNSRIIEYHKFVKPSFEKMKFNIYQIRTLEKLRDTLLPKLMSGEVRMGS